MEKEISRREFLKAAGLAAAGAVALSRSGFAQEETKPKEKPEDKEKDQPKTAPGAESGKEKPAAEESKEAKAEEKKAAPEEISDEAWDEEDATEETRTCPQCGGTMYRQGRTWTCSNCGYSYVE